MVNDFTIKISPRDPSGPVILHRTARARPALAWCPTRYRPAPDPLQTHDRPAPDPRQARTRPAPTPHLPRARPAPAPCPLIKLRGPNVAWTGSPHSRKKELATRRRERWLKRSHPSNTDHAAQSHQHGRPGNYFGTRPACQDRSSRFQATTTYTRCPPCSLSDSAPGS